MTDELLTSKWQRGFATTKTTAKVGAKALSYYSKRPFLSEEEKQKAKNEATAEGARSLFQALSLLRGTALKMAQQLSLESDILPPEVCRELARSYHQVPPLNRSIVRRVVKDGLGAWPEELFSQFDTHAFAAASLGQVHLATTKDQQTLAVKLQYPGIAETIDHDLKFMRLLLKPVFKEGQLTPALDEVADRLREEVDYLREAESLDFFSNNLKLEGIHIPHINKNFTSETIIATTLLPGVPLDDWIQQDPNQNTKDLVAHRLNNLFTSSLYELHTIHADPNPGNFLIDDKGNLGLVDYGCVKHLNAAFVEQYRQLTLAAAHRDHQAHYQLMIDTGIIPKNLPAKVSAQAKELCKALCNWYGKLFAEEIFDFSVNQDLMSEARQVMKSYQHIRPHLLVNPDYIFLDRTRYGLLKIFEQLGARVTFRNQYEYTK